VLFEGRVIGSHNGAVFFTLGERHGFTITEKSEKDKPYYVVAKDIKKNTITVATLPKTSPKQGLGLESHRTVLCINTNWIVNPPLPNKVYQAQIRYHGELLPCTIFPIGQTYGNCAEVVFKKDVLVDKGQSIVIYDKDICLGGGIVE
jgi:tRNA-specific 2-thiouridylase